MVRLIDADAFKKENERLLHCDFPYLSEATLEELIDEAPAIDAEPHWFPCSERLPEVRQWVLCQCRAGIMDVLRLTADGSWNKNPHREYMDSFVVAWMPLPEPYEVNHE